MPWADCVFKNWDDCIWQNWDDCIWDEFSIVYQDPKTRTERQFIESRVQNVEPIGGLRQVRHTRPGRQVETECRWLRYLDGGRWAKSACVGEAVVWDDDSSDDEIDPGGSANVAVTGGIGPYTWSVSPGDKFSVSAAETEGGSNTLNAEADACGTATITVTDFCGKSITGQVRSTTGRWVFQGTYFSDRTSPVYCREFQAAASDVEVIEGEMKWSFLDHNRMCAASTHVWPSGLGDCTPPCSPHGCADVAGPCSMSLNCGCPPCDLVGEDCPNPCTPPATYAWYAFNCDKWEC
jgi:hypothetical protein